MMEISGKFYRSAIENMMNGFALHSIVTDDEGNPKDYRYIDINRAFEEYTGLKRENVIGKTIREIEPRIEEDEINWISFFGQVALTGNSNSVEQYSAAFDRWYKVSAFCPAIGYFVAIFFDITELKKQAQRLEEKNHKLTAIRQELVANEWRLKKAQEIAQVGYWEWEMEANMIWGSEEAFHIYGLERNTPYLSREDALKIPLPEYQNKLYEAMKGLMENKPYDIHYEILAGDGKRRFVHSVANLEVNEEGKPRRAIGVIQDITKEIERETELKNKNEELTTLYEEILASEDELKKQNELLFQKNEEITALYEELSSQDEELRANYDQLTESMARLKKSEEINSLMLEATSEGVWQYDLVDDIYTISRNFVESLGYSIQELSSINKLHDITYPEDKEAAEQSFLEHLHGTTPKYELEYRMLCKDGSYRWVRSSGKVLKTSNGEAYLMAGTFTDITRMKEQQERLEHLAYYDVLTDLPNRALLLIELEKARKYADANNTKLAVIFMDLDNFKDINDLLGHNTGDELIREIAHRLKENLRSQDFLARLGGDEFVIFIQNVETEGEIYDFCLMLREKILEPFDLNRYRLNISPSMGIAMYPGDSHSGEEMIKNADTAMYRAKNLGKNNIQFFCEGMRTDMLRRLFIESRMRMALKHSRFTLNYQPQISLSTGKIRAFEALVRWTDEELGVLSPAEFIPIAESAGLIVVLGEWILGEACRQAKYFNTGNNEILISVNISAVQLKQNDFADMIKRTLKETGLPARFLELEVTETTMISSFDTTIQTLKELRDMGIKVSLDDFGTGYSSLSYLKKLPIDTLKIDKSFVDDLNNEYGEEKITEAIISLVHKLDIEVIAEGVETEKQLSYLIQCNCDNIQGYLMSRPVPASDVAKIIERGFADEIGIIA